MLKGKKVKNIMKIIYSSKSIFKGLPLLRKVLKNRKTGKFYIENWADKDIIIRDFEEETDKSIEIENLKFFEKMAN